MDLDADHDGHIADDLAKLSLKAALALGALFAVLLVLVMGGYSYFHRQTIDTSRASRNMAAQSTSRVPHRRGVQRPSVAGAVSGEVMGTDTTCTCIECKRI